MSMATKYGVDTQRYLGFDVYIVYIYIYIIGLKISFILSAVASQKNKSSMAIIFPFASPLLVFKTSYLLPEELCANMMSFERA